MPWPAVTFTSADGKTEYVVQVMKQQKLLAGALVCRKIKVIKR